MEKFRSLMLKQPPAIITQGIYPKFYTVEKILKGSLDLISSPSVKIQIIGGKVCLRRKGKTLLGIANKRLKTKKFVDITHGNVLPYYLK